MATDTTTNMSVPNSDVSISIKQTDHNALEGSNKGDHRAEANDVQMPPQDGPRDATGTKGV